MEREVEAVLTSVAGAIRSKRTPHTIVMRSTVPPRTAEDRLIPLLEHSGSQRRDAATISSIMPIPNFSERDHRLQGLSRATFHLDRRRAGR